jgi:hypothetical protein
MYSIRVGGTLNNGSFSGGVTAIFGTPTPSQPWFENTVTVAVTGGVLYVSNAKSAKFNKLDEIDIVQQNHTIDFSNGFAGATGLSTNGSAVVNGSNLQLTNGTAHQAGSAFSTNAVGISRFNTTFNFQLVNPSAEGFTFTIQRAGNTALGSSGGDLGYGGIAHSVAIKFDLANTSGEGTNSTGLYVNGASPTNTGSIDLTPSGVNLHSGDVFQVTMTYNGKTLRVTLLDTVTHASATQSYTINLSRTIGGSTAFVGFTGATGSQTATENILNWTFDTL